jgi:hypothetical protein
MRFSEWKKTCLERELKMFLFFCRTAYDMASYTSTAIDNQFRVLEAVHEYFTSVGDVIACMRCSLEVRLNRRSVSYLHLVVFPVR